MGATQLPLANAPHMNQQLFSDYYLNEILPDRAAWNQIKVPAQQALREIQALFADFVPSTNEPQTEDGLIKPILRLLGHTFEVQPALKTPDGTKKPDYVLYQNEDAVRAQKNVVLDDTILKSTAIAVADAKYWDRPLDIALTKTKGDPFNNRNPSYQIAFYMQHSGLPWGLLTNGRLWRLYHHDTAHKLDRFYEVDLHALAMGGDLNQFMYFYAFFRRDAFDSGPISLQALLQESIDYALKVGNQLKRQVFDALRHLAQGFLDYPQNQLSPAPETLKTIYDNSLILLYRLLFVAYAEARELLPIREEPYRSEYSLRAITHDIADAQRRGRQLLPTSGKRWAVLKELFHAINAGSPPLKVATFNGGLFDPGRHPFLEQYTVGDRHLDQAIDTIARVDGQFVDYRDLAEQHLGTIYEGLLEYHLAEIEPEGGWQVDLVNDRGERKKIGSYYTPNYIVKYIVDHTLKPLLDAAVAGKPDSEKSAAILNVNVLDPAMGSAYFLVEATEYIARYVVNLDLPLPEGVSETGSDLAYWKRQVVQSCVYGVDINPLAVELAKLSLWLSTVAKDRPLSFLDHHLRCGNSVVGSRSMMSRRSEHQKKAASKRAKQAATAAAKGQLSLVNDGSFQQKMSTAVDAMWLIETNSGETVEDVKTQEELYRSLRSDLIGKYGRLADLVTANDFGLAISDSLWPSLSDYALGRALLVPPEFQRWTVAADEMADRERFFHWDLEFPEVFYDRFGRSLGDDAGFDAVIGNPPYVRQETLSGVKRYLFTAFPSVYYGTADLFVYFIEQGVHLLRARGRISYISSNSWLRANYAEPLRRFLRTEVTVKEVIDIGDNRVFESAPDVYPSIFIIENTPPPKNYSAYATIFSRGEGIDRFDPQVAAKLQAVSISDQSDEGWRLSGSEEFRILNKLLTSTGRTLSGLMEASSSLELRRGVTTGDNEVFIVDRITRDQLIQEHESSANLLKPLLQGEHLKPWHHERPDLWLIFARRGIVIEDFPAIHNYLSRFRKQLEPKPKVWTGDAKWPGRKSGPYKWYELQDSTEYFAVFERPKIIYPDIARNPRFSFDTDGFYLGNTAYVIAGAEPWLLAYLSSRCAWFLISHISIPFGERAGMNRYRLVDQYMRRLPVPHIGEASTSDLNRLSQEISASAQMRAEIQSRFRMQILRDLGTSDSKLNQKLTSWWELDFSSFRAEIKKAFKREIPVRERDEWDAWLTEQQQEHERLTEEIIRLETELNALVYELFDLSADDIVLIEESTKYAYGEV